jgi:hypothetical protein
MRGSIPPLPQYAFIEWCSVKAQGQLYFMYIYILAENINTIKRITEAMLLGSKEVGLKANPEKTMYLYVVTRTQDKILIY